MHHAVPDGTDTAGRQVLLEQLQHATERLVVVRQPARADRTEAADDVRVATDPLDQDGVIGREQLDLQARAPRVHHEDAGFVHDFLRAARRAFLADGRGRAAAEGPASERRRDPGKVYQSAAAGPEAGRDGCL